MSRLRDEIAALIAAEGPISVARYMELALGHPKLGYYVTRDPLGRAGDFITAPEISQMFGELIGLWLAQVWLDQGQPESVRLVELGPGRGTLMADLLRAARSVPGLGRALQVHLVETSPVLRQVQAETLRGVVAPRWHDDLRSVPDDSPLFLVANEFLDALPIHQFMRTGDVWRERLVGLVDGQLGFGLSPAPETALKILGPEGAVLETSPAGHAVTVEIAGRIARSGGAALLIDYGHARSAFGDTLQAVRNHAFTDPLAVPGEADITAHVDFAAMAASARGAGAVIHGPVEQGAFLTALGLAARAERLMAGKPEEQAAVIAGQRDRLIDAAPRGMGALFKVMAVMAPNGPPPPGFG